MITDIDFDSSKACVLIIPFRIPNPVVSEKGIIISPSHVCTCDFAQLVAVLHMYLMS